LSKQVLLLRKRRGIIPLKSEVETTETRAEADEWVRGPLGIWPWPILNAILMFFRRLREIATGAPSLPLRKRRVTIYEVIRDPATGRITSIEEHEREEYE
jgi:hypothetical protein